MDKLWSWPNRLLSRDFSNRNYVYINYNELSNDYLLCRQAISNYLICLVFEHVLSGNVDEKSKNKVINKVTTQRILWIEETHKANSGNFPSNTRLIA